MDGTEPEAVLEEEGESTAAELGRLLFKNAITHVFHFTGTGRFSACTSGQDLVHILAHMRRCEPFPANLWAKLETRAVKEGQPDARLLDPKFLEGHEGALVWELVARLQQRRAQRDAVRLRARLFYCQAVDTPLNAKDAFTRPDAMEALAVVNLTTTAYLLGMCPLFIGMQIRLSRTLQNTPLLVREVTGTVRNIQFHDREPSDWRGRDASQPVVLRYLPNAVVVELDAADMRSTTFCEGLAPGYIIIPPEEGQRTWRRTIATEATKSGRAALQTEMLRRQIPLAPRFVNTHF